MTSAFGTRTSALELPAVDAQHPWLGLVSYTEENRQYFHGRDEEARELVRRLERKTLTVLFGQSGLGKSSLLQAGAFPRLRTAGFVPVYIRLDHGPAAPSLAGQIKPAVLAETSLMGTWSKSGSAEAGESLWEYFHHRDDVLTGGAGRKLTPVLVFDQFEELFTLGSADDATRARAAAFLTELADLVENRAPATFEARVDAGTAAAEAFDFARSDYRVLITLREDYLPHLESLKASMPSLMQNRMRLTRLSGAQALEAVVEPSPGLVPVDVAQSIVAFVSGRNDLAQAEVEPSLLSLVCRELNHRRLAAGVAQIDAALLAGSRETILTEFYERTLADQPAAVRHWVENELLTDSGYRENIALERARKSLTAAGADPAAIDTLVSRRLLRIEERLDVRRIELTHDVLCAVVRASRDTRREREAAEEAKRRRLETEAALVAARAGQATVRRRLRIARLMLAGCAVLAGAAIYGFWEASKARARAEKLAAIADQSLATANTARAQTTAARNQADAARLQAQELLVFLNRDLSDRIEDVGQLPLLREMSERVVRYYAGLPPVLLTREVRAEQALALARYAAVLSIQREFTAGRAKLSVALDIYAALAREAPLAPAMIVDRSAAKMTLADFENIVQDHTRAAQITAEVAEALAPLVDETDVGRRAEDIYVQALRWTGNYTAWSGDQKKGITLLQQAVAAARQQDRRQPPPRRPGLAEASIGVWLADNLSMSGQPDEARQMVEHSRAVLRKYVEREPTLQSARAALAQASNRAGLIALRSGKMELARQRNEEALAAAQEFLKTDPRNVNLLNQVQDAHMSLSWFKWVEGDFAGAREEERKSLAVFSDAEGERLNNMTQINASGDIAQWSAALGEDAEAERMIAQAHTYARQLNADLTDRPVQQVTNTTMARQTEIFTRFAQLRWADVRRLAEVEIAELKNRPPVSTWYGEDARADAFLLRAAAAYASGDLAAVAESMQSAPDRIKAFDRGKYKSFAERYNAVYGFGWDAVALAAVGRRAEAEALLDRLQPLSDSLLADATGTLAAGRQLNAFYGWVAATADSRLDVVARRKLLEDAIVKLGTLRDGGKLARFDREFTLVRSEAALAALGQTAK
jgi:tetratricopeptide (TPR) repeat protein